MATNIILEPNKTVRIDPTDPPDYAPYFPAYHLRTLDPGQLVGPSGGWIWTQSWEGYCSPRADDGEGLQLYTRYDFHDDGTFAYWACLPCRILYTGTWSYVLA